MGAFVVRPKRSLRAAFEGKHNHVLTNGLQCRDLPPIVSWRLIAEFHNFTSGGSMAVLMIAEQPGLDRETYASMLEQLRPLLRSANGFISHSAGPSPAGGTRIIEIWESEADSQRFFNEKLKPNLPPGAVPDLKYYELHAAFTR
jgi:hypothetical protein